MYKCNQDNMIYIIKLKGSATDLDNFRKYLVESQIPENPCAYYNLRFEASITDKEIFEDMKKEKEFSCAILDYEDEDITCLYWGKCHKYCENSKNAIHCKLLYKTEDKLMIDNFVYNLQLDLNKDFDEDSFINYEISVPLLDQFRKFEKEPYKTATKSIHYNAIKNEKLLSDLAQKNEYCCRKYNLREPNDRGEFQRDYDRIIYSKAYRRMVDKAQIFSSVKGDHYRTRMTHTLIVCQIARSICDRLKLNSSLAEAIAAGHDLGHTPFGHQGERTLRAILTGKSGFEVDDLAIIIDGKDPQYFYGGFKHNYQSVRVATSLESQYLEIDGLDLSEQTLDGMWKHTKQEDGMNIKDFSDGYLSDTEKFAFTMEGQVVFVADEIAQRSHDIDDAFASHLITISNFKDYLELRKHAKLSEKINEISRKLEELKKKNKLFVDENEVICTQISSIIIKYFIDDVCEATQIKMENYSSDEFNNDDHRLKEKLVCFSDEGKGLSEYLENLIAKKVINSHEVTLFDQNGSNIVLALFKAYYKNPMLLHDGTLKRIWNEYRQHNFDVVDFKEGNPEFVKQEWKKITHDSNCLDLLYPDAKDEDLPDNLKKQEEYFEKRKILVRNICDFISGMTDSYALNEYHRIIS